GRWQQSGPTRVTPTPTTLPVRSEPAEHQLLRGLGLLEVLRGLGLLEGNVRHEVRAGCPAVGASLASRRQAYDLLPQGVDPSVHSRKRWQRKLRMPHPSSIGRYEIVDELGRGGMGNLYLAKDPLLQRTVALKQLRVDMGDVEEYRERFLREAR